MPTINVNDLITSMLGAAAQAGREHWPQIRDSVGPQFEELAEIAARIEERKNNNTMNEPQERAIVKIQENALKAVVAGMSGQAKVAAQAAVNAALNVLRTTLNGALGFPFL